MKKSWPVVRKSKRPGTGEKAWLVDGRFQRGGSDYGKRHFCDTEAAAKELARQLKIQRANEGSRIFEVTAADIDELKAAREKLESIAAKDGETLAEALAELEAARLLLFPFGKSVREAAEMMAGKLEERRRLKSRTVRECIDELISGKKSEGLSSRYLGDLESRLFAFAEDFGTRHADSVEKTELEEWLLGLRISQKGRANHGAPLSATSRNNFRRVLGVLFAFACDRGYSVENPAAKVTKAKVVGGEVGILTVEQTNNLLSNSASEIIPFLAIGAFAGLRRAEIERLDWSEIDLIDGLIEVKASKAKSARRRFVHISKNLALWLRPFAKISGPVVEMSLENLRIAFEDSRKSAGIERWPANALRHSFASYHLAKHRDAAALALEMGHSNSSLIFEHYRQLVRPAAAESYWNIVPGSAKNVIAISEAV